MNTQTDRTLATAPEGTMRYMKVWREVFAMTYLFAVRNVGTWYDTDGAPLYDEWEVVNDGSVDPSGIVTPGDRFVLFEDELVPVVTVNWARIPA